MVEIICYTIALVAFMVWIYFMKKLDKDDESNK